MVKVTIEIQGHGMVKVKRPKVLNEETFADAMSEAVVKTCQLLSPPKQSSRFHPVLGLGGYESSDSRRAS